MQDFQFTVEDIALTERPVQFRMPFRFGIVTLREAPEAHVKARIKLPDGRNFSGISADLMAPKWFDKNPNLSNDQNFEQLRLSVGHAQDQYLAERTALSAYTHHALHVDEHYAKCAKLGLNGLVAGFGSAMVDRAIFDACCNAFNISFYEGVRSNLAGITEQTAPDLDGFDVSGFLSNLKPADQICIRHTVGLTDAITDAQVPADDGHLDGLPRSLEANCSAYNLRAFKLKISGDTDADIARLLEIAAILDALPHTYLCTLDGNEQFNDPEEFEQFWKRMLEHPKLATLAASVAYFEQPISRQSALSVPLGALGEQLAIEIDESDADMDAFLTARTLGYRGVSSKSCKGLYRSLLNRCRVEKWNMETGGNRYFMSAEDLCTQAGTALEQDLALASIIGCDHVERNGHQYGDGLSGGLQTERDELARRNPALYELSGKRANLIINQGMVNIKSLQ